MTMEGGAGVVPVMDLNRNNYGDGFGYGGGAWFMWIIVLFALMGGWGNNRNNGLESALTRSDLAKERPDGSTVLAYTQQEIDKINPSKRFV